MSSYKVTVFEGTVIFVNLICNKFLLFTPEYLRQANSSGSIIMLFVSFFIMGLSWYLLNKFSVFEKSFSKVFGIVITLIYVLFTAFYLNQYIEIVKTISLNDFSIYFIGAVFILAMIFGALSGIKALSRAHALFMPFIYLSALILIISSFSSLNPSLLFPVFGKGVTHTIKNGFFLLSLFLEFAGIFILKDNFKNSADFKKTGFYAIILSFVICLVIEAGYIMSFAENFNYEKYPPVFQIIRQVESGQYFQRFDSLFLIMFSVSSFLFLGAQLYLSSLSFSKTFNLPTNRYSTLPISFIIISLGFINSLQFYITDLSKYLNMFLWIVPTILPIFPRKGKSV